MGVILRTAALGIAMFFLSLAVSLGSVDGFLGIDYTMLNGDQLTMYKYSFYTMFVVFMMVFAFIGGGDR